MVITCEQLCLTSRVSKAERKATTLAHLCLRQNMASIFALKEIEQRKFVKVPRSARSRFCDLQNAHHVECCIIEQYFVKENIELCTVFCSGKLCAEDSFDDSADEAHLPLSAALRGKIIVTSHLRSMIDDSKLLLDIKKLYGSDFFDDAVQVLFRYVSG